MKTGWDLSSLLFLGPTLLLYCFLGFAEHPTAYMWAEGSSITRVSLLSKVIQINIRASK